VQTDATRGIGHDAVVAAVSAATGGVVRPIVDQVTSLVTRPKPTPPESPLILPPGVDRDDQ
jgi:hypothetical protein